MPQATCRCGQALTIPGGGAEWVTCPGCGTKLRVRPKASAPPSPSPSPSPVAAAAGDDGFVRFRCSCGKKLKVNAASSLGHGQCPDCGAVVPVPRAEGSPGSSALAPVPSPGSRTAEMPAADRSRLEAWGRAHSLKQAPAGPEESDIPGPSESALPAQLPSLPNTVRTEAGLRLCPNCRKPAHLSADVCRHCGTSLPRR